MYPSVSFQDYNFAPYDIELSHPHYERLTAALIKEATYATDKLIARLLDPVKRSELIASLCTNRAGDFGTENLALQYELRDDNSPVTFAALDALFQAMAGHAPEDRLLQACVDRIAVGVFGPEYEATVTEAGSGGAVQGSDPLEDFDRILASGRNTLRY